MRLGNVDMKYLLHLEDPEALDSGCVGQKFSILAKAHGDGFPVPPAVALTTSAHRFYLKHGCWPEGLFDEVYHAAESLGLEKGLSIRSSAIREDLENQSFAGQYRTFLEVTDQTELKEKIQQCWSSADADHVRSYLKSTSENESSDTPLMGIIIQLMVRARVSGVAFGCNPMRPDSGEVVIEAVTGLADKLVNGHTTPYRGIVTINGSVDLNPPKSGANYSVQDIESHLNRDKWRQIAAMAQKLEKVNGGSPQDIEWAIDPDQKLWLLQTRAITTLPAKRVSNLSGIWTRKIANDLWADRLSPFLADIMEKTAPLWNLSKVSRWVGVPVVEPAVVVINGYLYVNCSSIRAAISALPVSLRFEFLNHLMPPEASVEDVPAPALPKTLLRLARIMLLPLAEPGSVPVLSAWLTRRHMAATRRRLNVIDRIKDSSVSETHRKLNALLSELTRIQIKNQWPYFYAAALTWLLQWLLIEKLGMTQDAFLKVAGRGGDNVSLRIEKHFRSIAERIKSDPSVAAAVCQSRPGDMLNHLPDEIVQEILDAIGRYGCRSRHRSLYVKRWSEDPGEILSILHKLVAHGQPQAQRSQSQRGQIRLPFWVKPIVGLTTTFLDLREDLRFLLDRCLFLLRQFLLQLGDKTGLGDRVFFLKPDELADFVRGKREKEDIVATANRRREAFLESSEASTFIVDGYPADEFPRQDHILKGIGSSPGLVSGRARVVEDPTQADFEKGDILIAKNTDPGWTPILSIVGGMVMEEGGLLNHCSIVARELGIPSIVGVEHATRRIPDGVTVHLDGGRGIIRIANASPDSENQPA